MNRQQRRNTEREGPRVLDGAQLQRLVEVTAQLGPWAMPLVQALREGTIAVQFLCRTTRAPLAAMCNTGRPTLAWIGDDDADSSGPAAWRSAHQVTQWARGGIVHAAGGEARHYETAVRGTVEEGRFVLVETSSRHAAAWLALLVGKPVLTILPRGGPHPAVGRETRH